jgi:hypothetical protein
MYWRIFRNKWFWITWLIVSVIGGVTGYLMLQNREQKIAEAEVFYVREFREGLKWPTIHVVENSAYKEDYLNYFQKNELRSDMRLQSLNQGQKVYLLEFSEDSLLARIALINENPSMQQGYYNEYWIWHEYLTKDSLRRVR